MAEEKADLKITPQPMQAPEPEIPQPQAPITEGEVNPLDVLEEKKDDSDIVSNIVENETATEENILGAAPTLDESLLQDMEPPKSTLLSVLKLCFGLLIIAGIAGFAFFKIQLSEDLNALTAKLNLQNVSKELSSTNSEILKLQTDINFARYKQIKGYLDMVSYHADGFIQNYNTLHSQTATQADKRNAEAKIVQLKESLGTSFLALKELYIQSFTSPLGGNVENIEKVFEDNLLMLIKKESDLIADGQEPEVKRKHKKLEEMVSVVVNKDLKNLVLNTDFGAMGDKEIYDLLKNIGGLIKNDLNVIQSIKEQRIKWSDIINEIELRTIAVDNYYTEDFYEELGGILYTSYDFDKNNRSISIVGETKRYDTKNFTMIANLIDELNRSEFFRDGEMRSFSKSGSLTDGYTAILKLTLKLKQ